MTPLLLWSLVLLVSLAVLIKASEWFTASAERVGLALGMPAFMVGGDDRCYLGAGYTVRAVVEIARIADVGAELIAASAIALGTSLPEVAVTVNAARRGRPEIALGNVVGSNVFNSFAVIGVSGLVGPLVVPDSITAFALPVMLIATLLAFFMIMEKDMTKWEGWLLVLFYVSFIGALFNVM